ncbi:MAG: hypothetical protein K2O34_08870, partial [Acetatifactor sp.]|nr:hypothetical protein [Acetatifactor sp.]
MDKKEQKNIINEILEEFNSPVIVNLERNTYAQYFRREDASQSESVERGAYTELLHSLYCGICPLGDESATLEEYLYPACIRRMMTQGSDRLQWEYEDGEKLRKILYVLCIQREDDVPVRLLLGSHNRDGQAESTGIFERIEASFGSLAQLVSDSGSYVDQECLNQEDYQNRRALLAEDNTLSREVME